MTTAAHEPTAPCRVLFVDDERRVLDGIARLLRSVRRGWDVSTALGPSAALDLLRGRPFDVVVSDMRMPVMDGVSLLSAVHAEAPSTVRIVLSGQADPEAVVRAAPVAHQLLSKPCDTSVLTTAIESARRAQTRCANDALRAVVGGVRALPSSPIATARLNDLVSRDDVDLGLVADEITCDVGLTAKVLQLVNAPFFGARHRIHAMREAVQYLGVTLTRNLVLSIAALSSFGPALDRAGLNLATFYARAARISALAKRSAPPAMASEASTCGLLHGVGTLVLASHDPDAFRSARAAEDAGVPRVEAERRAFGFTCAEAGGALVGLWGFGSATVDAVLHHASPNDAPAGAVTLASILRDAHAAEGAQSA